MCLYADHEPVSCRFELSFGPVTLSCKTIADSQYTIRHSSNYHRDSMLRDSILEDFQIGSLSSDPAPVVIAACLRW